MTNKEAIDYMNTLQAKCENGYEAEAINLAIKALEERPIVEKIITKGGMTLALRKPDREISNLANVIADMLGDINVRELKDKFNTITFTDTNTGCIVKYCRVDDKEANDE